MKGTKAETLAKYSVVQPGKLDVIKIQIPVARATRDSNGERQVRSCRSRKECVGYGVSIHAVGGNRQRAQRGAADTYCDTRRERTRSSLTLEGHLVGVAWADCDGLSNCGGLGRAGVSYTELP